MTILQCSRSFTNGAYLLFGTGKPGSTSFRTRMRTFTYISADPRHTKQWYGQFKLELIK